MGDPVTSLNETVSTLCTIIAAFTLGWLFIAVAPQAPTSPSPRVTPGAVEVRRSDTTAPGRGGQEPRVAPAGVQTRD